LKTKPEEEKDQTLQTKPLADSIKSVVQQQMVKDVEEQTEPIQANSAGSRANNFQVGADVETQILEGQIIMTHELTHVIQQNNS
jgi:hypothetical protein